MKWPGSDSGWGGKGFYITAYTARFYTSDDVGEYVICFPGMDEKGLPAEFHKTFAVGYHSD